MSTSQIADTTTPRMPEIAAATPAPINFRPTLPLTQRRVTTVPRPEADRAFDLIGEISNVLPALLTKCAALDAAIATTRKQAKEDIEKIAESTVQWQRRAESLKQQTIEIAQATVDYRRRAEVADAEAQTLGGEAEKLKRTAIEAVTFNTLFQQRIVSSFGVGSPGRVAIDSAAPRASSKF